jgi:polysaccharide biosynthesis protein PslH
MKILQICPRIPFPLDDGGKIGIYNITKYLHQRNHDITLVAVTGIATEQDRAGMSEICDFHPLGLSSSLSIAHIPSLVSDTPINIAKFQDARISESIVELASKESFDLVHLDHLHMMYYGIALKAKLNLPLVLREHNIESKILKRLAENQSNPIYKWILTREWQKLERYEISASSLCESCLTITPIDDALLKELNPHVNSIAIPAGVDDSFVPSPIAEEPATLLYNAPLNWQPNVESLLWFLDRVFPLILLKNPDMVLWIIGKNPPAKILKYAGDRVKILGYVDDIYTYMARSTVIISPILVGSGIRIKILNSFAMAKAVVSTSVGCEGIMAQHDLHLQIADTPTDFADAVISLVEDPDRRRKLGQNARNLIKAHYQWEDIAAKIESVYQMVCK